MTLLKKDEAHYEIKKGEAKKRITRMVLALVCFLGVIYIRKRRFLRGAALFFFIRLEKMT